MSATKSAGSAEQKRNLIAVIADEDTTTGLLLAGVGQITPAKESVESEEGLHNNNSTDSKVVSSNLGKNFFVYKDGKTTRQEIDDIFHLFTEQRKDIALLLINQHVADLIRSSVDNYTAAFPAILEIPSKDHPYNPEKDSVLKRVRKLFGE
ncbi:H(+)-transporting V1 sector ATPase subunit F [Hanseniaspora osmophila]|uniref:V-type proton ATPase subunit F n=1 Tax=Hanseniaspora osmophila TaxID=56408 RepID=A0A1E5RBS9_9ASCO|nr:V-type proton ATPase subunit F [Hanseniaspora osmophila]